MLLHFFIILLNNLKNYPKINPCISYFFCHFFLFTFLLLIFQLYLLNILCNKIQIYDWKNYILYSFLYFFIILGKAR